MKTFREFLTEITGKGRLASLELKASRDEVSPFLRDDQQKKLAALKALQAYYLMQRMRGERKNPYDEVINLKKAAQMAKAKKRLRLTEESDFEVTHEGWHGSPDARGILKDGFKTRKQVYDQKDDKPIYWVAKDHKVATSYANPHRAFDYQNSEPKTLPVQLSMKNPKVINWEGKPFRGRDKDGKGYAINDHIEAARKAGHDGFVIHRVIDTYHAKGKPSTIMGVFHPKNIRVKK